MSNTLCYVELTVKIVVGIDMDNPDVNFNDLQFNEDRKTIFPVRDDGENVKGYIVRAETLSSRKV